MLCIYYSATIGAFALGNGIGWSSPALPSISCHYNVTEFPDDLKFCLDDEEQKWTGSLLCIGALIAPLVKTQIMKYKQDPKKNISILTAAKAEC